MLTAAICALAAGCGSDSEARYVSLPPAAETYSSLLLAVFDGPELLRIQAHELDPLPTIRLAEDGSESTTIRLEAALFDEELDTLGLTPGIVIEAEPNAAHSRRLRAPDRSFELAVASDSEWNETATTTARLAVVDLPLDCGLEHVRTLGIPSPYDILMVFSVPNGPLLVSTEEGRLFAVEGESVQEVTVSGGAAPSTATILEGSDELWFGGINGGLYRGQYSSGRLDLTLVVFSGEQVHSMAGRVVPETGEPEIFVLGYLGLFNLYSGGRMSFLHRFDRSMSVQKHLGGLAFIGPEEAIAAVESTTEIVRYRRGLTALESTPSTGGFASAAYARGLGAVLGTVNGEIFVEPEGSTTWEPIQGFALGRWISALAPFDDGFVFGTAFGSAGYYLSDLGVCEPKLISSFNINRATAHGAQFVLAGDNPNAPDTPVTFVELR